MGCPFYTFKSGLIGGDYWCIKNNCSVNSEQYYKYCRNYDYNYCAVYNENKSTGCFVTTIVCKILKKDDDCELLNNFRNFRDNVLQQNPAYYETLKQYDTIGPIIVQMILQRDDKEEIAAKLYAFDLLDINREIKSKNELKAVTKYTRMIKTLIKVFNLEEVYNRLQESNYGYEEFTPELAGHGYVRTLKKDITNK